jgi:N-acylneuraminate cytidylyltransferase
VGVVESSPFLWRGPQGDAIPGYDVNVRPRRQDLTEHDHTYRECGSIYVTRADAFRASSNRISGRVGLLVLESDEGIDIDTPDDLVLAERMLTGLDA